MFYDNAQLARVYLHAWQVTGEPFYRTIVEETLDYVVREMTSPEGGFYSTQDADSEGEEAKFFVWTPDEIRAVLGDRADRFIEVYGGSGSRKPHYLGECYSLTFENVHLTTELLEIKILVLGSTNIIY
jgi:uncharacterized protein YyaL (SSP411 family)